MSRFSGSYDPDPNKYSLIDKAPVTREVYNLRLTTSEQRVKNTHYYKSLAEHIIYLIIELAKHKGIDTVREFFDYQLVQKNSIVITTNSKYEDIVDLSELHRLFYYLFVMGETRHNHLRDIQILKYKGENAEWQRTNHTMKSLTWSLD